MTVDEEDLDIDAEGTKCKICKRQIKHGAKMVHGRGNRETLRCDGLCRVRRLRGKYGDAAGLKAKEEPEQEEVETKCEICSKILSPTASDKKCLLSETVCNGRCEQRKDSLMLPNGSRCKICRKKVKQNSRDRRFCNGLCAAGTTVAVPKDTTRS